MKSVASIKSHPIHPMLVGFPITFLISAFVCDLVGRLIEDPRWWTVGAWLALAGIISAFIAAVPGLIDYLYTIPPNSSGKKRGTQHMLANLTAVALFIAAWIIRGGPVDPPNAFVLLLEGVGLVMLGVGGWLGATLVYRNFIGPDHRYANAGRWKEVSPELGGENGTALADEGELEVDQMKLVRLNGRRLVLARTSDGYILFDDHCTHRGGSLAGGVMIDGSVQCLWHGSRFNVKTGQVCAGPAEKAIATYPVEVREGKVWLKP